jgi:hypothetical protein
MFFRGMRFRCAYGDTNLCQNLAGPLPARSLHFVDRHDPTKRLQIVDDVTQVPVLRFE